MSFSVGQETSTKAPTTCSTPEWELVTQGNSESLASWGSRGLGERVGEVRGHWVIFWEGWNLLLVTLTLLSMCSCCLLQTTHTQHLSLSLCLCLHVSVALPLLYTFFSPLSYLLYLSFLLAFLSSLPLCPSVFFLWGTEKVRPRINRPRSNIWEYVWHGRQHIGLCSVQGLFHN